jgi:poly-gamma-glutamate synthesis protein (capsule biosynthesis protein)
VGDALIATRLGQYNDPHDPGFHSIVKIVQSADLAFLNLEGSHFRFSEFHGWAEAEHGGYWQVGPPEALVELKEMGFNLFNTANNHTIDWGVEGMRLTHKHLNELGLVHSGSGMNLGLASRPGYLETVKGRFALIGMASTFTPMSRAGAARSDVRGRPGLNPLRVDRRYEADPETFEALRGAAGQWGARIREDPKAPIRLHREVSVWPGAETRVVETVHQRDDERILREIGNAAKQADQVIVNSHSHEPGNDSPTPPGWLEDFARKSLDAGASTFLMHGAHQLRGIEIYEGKPIFYGLGDFIFQEELYDPLPSDIYELYDLPETALTSDVEDARFIDKDGTAKGFPSNYLFYESFVAVMTFEGSELKDLKLYPIELNRTARRPQRGIPRIADEATGRKIIERIARLSEPYGTEIVYEGGIGIWVPGPAKTTPSAK